MAKDVILTGIRANNDLHIGNYFGAILPMIDMAKNRSDEYQINMFIPDLHSFTTPIDHTTLYDSIMNNARVYAAAGLPLENENINLYRQSQISAHSELTVLLNNFVGFGEMERMTQFKDKSTKLSNDRLSVGLFDYPVLMASDILLYNAKYIPVGDDQTQHLEITRDIAIRLNNRFGDLFTVPEEVSKQHEFFGKDQGLRIKDLVDPAKKMSKSDETGKGIIFLTDTPDEARKKIMSATTDDKASIAYDKAAQPGISNLLDILTLMRQANGKQVTLDETIAEFIGVSRYGDFKSVVADEVVTFLMNFQANYANVDMNVVESKLLDSEAAMRQVANETLHKVQIAVGIRKAA
jgi:tryptophanyl-tRNA synthetase